MPPLLFRAQKTRPRKKLSARQARTPSGKGKRKKLSVLQKMMHQNLTTQQSRQGTTHAKHRTNSYTSLHSKPNSKSKKPPVFLF